MRNPSIFTALTPVLASLVVACSDTGGAAEADAEVASSLSAIVAVERTMGPGDMVRTETVARFVRSRRQDAMGAASVDLPPPGRCRPATGAGTAMPRAFELLDVGPVRLEVGNEHRELLPRRVPDVGGHVGGVVFTHSVDRAVAPKAKIVVSTPGSRELEVPPFQGSLTVPEDLGDFRIGGQDNTGALLTVEGALDLSWEGIPTDDAVYVDLYDFGGGTSFRCNLATDSHPGIMRIDAAFVPGPRGVLKIHRVHDEPMSVPGYDAVSVRVDSARILTYARP